MIVLVLLLFTDLLSQPPECDNSFIPLLTCRFHFVQLSFSKGAEVLSGIARLSGALHFLTAPDSHEICWEGVVLYYGDLVRSLAVATLSTLFGVVIFRYASRSFIPTHAAASLALGSRIALFVAWLLPLGLFLYWTFGSLWKLDGGRNATYTFGCSPLSAATDIASFLPFIFVFSLVYLVVAASLSIFALRKRKEMTAAVTTDPRGVFEYMQPVGYHLRLVLAFFFDPISWIPAFVIRFIPSAPLWLGDLNIACSAMRGPLAFLVFFLSLRLYKPPSRPTSERHVSTPGVGSAKRIASQKNNIFQPFIEPTSGSDME